MPAAAYQLSFQSSHRLLSDALNCLLWRRGRWAGPVALVLFPIVMFMVMLDPAMRILGAALGGAALMLLVIFLIVAGARRRAIDRAFGAGDRTIHIALSDRGIAISSVLGDSLLNWSTIHRIWSCPRVTLLFYSGWLYVPIPAEALPSEALDYIQRQVGAARGTK